MPEYTSMPEPWEPAVATRAINHLVKQMELNFAMKKHAIAREDLRNIVIGDVLHILKTGFVYEKAEEASRKGCYKYNIEGRSPNSGNRTIRIVVIPYEKAVAVKVLTVMWVD